MSIRLEIEFSEEEKQLLDEAVWYQLSLLILRSEIRQLDYYEKDEFEAYKNIYKKLGNELKVWIKEVKLNDR